MNVWKISTFALASALAVVVGTSSIGGAFADDKKEPPKAQAQPNMTAALDLLEKAHDRLEKATSDKGGHRVKAMKLVKDAIGEVKEGIKFDNENVSKDEKKKLDEKKDGTKKPTDKKHQ